MTLRIGRVLSDGISLALSRNGAVLSVLFLLVESFGLLLVLGVGTTYVPVDVGTGVAPGSEVAVGSELPALTAAAASMLAGLFTSVLSVPLSIVAIRTFVGSRTETIPDEYLFDRIGRATLSGIVASFLQGAIVFGVTFGAGIVFLLGLFSIGGLGLSGLASAGALLLFGIVVGLVGLVLLFTVTVHFVFLLHEIAVRDRGVVGAFRGSWATVRGNRLRLTGLVVVVGGVRGSVSALATPPVQGSLTTLQTIVTPIGLVLASVIGVVVTAVFARTYRELRPDVSTEFATAGDRDGR